MTGGVGARREVIFRDLAAIVEDMLDLELEFDGPISPETRLVRDLNFQSIDFVMLLVAIQGRFRKQDLPFDELLMRDGSYVDDLRLAEVVDFLERRLDAV